MVPAVEVTLEELTACRWQKVVESASPRDCLVYAQRFSAARSEAESTGDLACTALGLLEDVCSPMLWSDKDEVLAPRELVEKLPDQQLDSLGSFLTDITDAELRARVGDILWLRRHDVRAAEVAVGAYLESAAILENPREWSRGFARIERALRLAASLGKRNELFIRVIAYIEEALARLDGKDPLYLSAKMMELLLEHRAGHDPKKYATLASDMAAIAGSAHDWWRVETLYGIAARWFERAKDAEGARTSKVAGAEGFVSMASEKAAEGQPGVAAMHVQHAIEAYRRIGKESGRVEALLQLMRGYQQQALAGFRSFSTTVDLTDEVKRAMSSVRGKPTLVEAVIALATASASPCVASIRETIREGASASPTQFLLPRAIVDARTGRTTGRRGAGSVDSSEEAAESAMFEHAKLLQHLTASMLEPARRVICEEHHVRDRDLLPIVRSSPFIPPGREERFARGLAAGLRGDFMVAAALLVPQIENSLRFVVEQKGGRGFGLDDEGIQDAHLLEHLLAQRLVEEIFGEDVVFDLRGLLIERFGTNLRNQDAHGLLDDADYYSTNVAYFWWVTLRLCVLFSLAAVRRAPT